jgi:flagellar hook-associated protein 1 FlgK
VEPAAALSKHAGNPTSHAIDDVRCRPSFARQDLPVAAILTVHPGGNAFEFPPNAAPFFDPEAGTSLAREWPGSLSLARPARPVSLNGILNSGLSAILTNSAALRVSSNNIANVNTPGYVRRVANLGTQVAGGQLGGVQIADIKRVVNNYLDKEVLDAGSNAARYDVQSSILDQLNATLGQPGDGHSIGSEIDAVYSALGQASLDPASLATRLGVVNQFQSLAQSVSGLAASVASLRTNADQQVGATVAQANSLIKQIFDLNPLIQRAVITGDTATGLLDQRDQLVSQLSQLMGIRTNEQGDGRMFLSTTDGVQLISDAYAQLDYEPSAGPSFKPVTVQMLSPLSGLPVGTAQIFDPHATSGQLRGLLDMRDHTLVGIGAELGSLAQSMSLAFNAEHNANATVPPPRELDGRQTGLLNTDALNFTGATTIGIADSSGNLVHKIAVDFDAGTISVDGGAAGGIGSTVGSFVAALDAALGANGSADFSNGELTLSATGSNGFVIADDAANPSSRGGLGFSHFFGLNDLFKSAGNSVVTTGLSASDAHGLAPGGAMTLLLKGPDGQRAGETTVSVTGTTIGDMVTALNTAFTGKATFTLDANGQIQVTRAAAYANYDLEVTLDTTARGTTGESFSSLFGLGTGEAMARAQSFDLRQEVAASPQRLAFAKPSLDATTALGSTVVTPGDNRGLLGLQGLANQTLPFAAAGMLPARNATFADYTSAFYQEIAQRGSAINNAKDAQDMRLQVAQGAQSQSEGVNLDEELEKMMMYQQAYNAGARVIRVTQELYDELLNAVGN